MEENIKLKLKNIFFKNHWGFLLIVVFSFGIFFSTFANFFVAASYKKGAHIAENNLETIPVIEDSSPLDIDAYDQKLNAIANNPIPKVVIPKKDPEGKQASNGAGKNDVTVSTKPSRPNLWPVKTVYPNGGAILPFSRIVAYYGNLYSTKMGVLGEYPETEMFTKLSTEVKKWEDADPSTPVVPALHYIAVVAQGSPGADGKYRFRMPDSEIDKVITMAAKINAIVFLDFQVGFSNVQAEVPHFEKYLEMPQVHVGLDPEFSMKSGIRPGKIVGTMDATDVNFVANYLAKIVKENNLPPKVLIVHRYTEKMVTNYKQIKPLPEVEIVMNMDGWGEASKKVGTYKNFIYPEPVQFTGFKLFYKNDILTKGTTIMTPKDLLTLNPQPVYIQYQ